MLALALVYYFNNDEEVSYTKPQWNCTAAQNSWKCAVSFEVTNETHTELMRNVSIRAVKLPADGKYSSLKIYGEIVFEVLLAPKETYKIDEILSASRKPNEIKVNVWK